MKIIYLVFPEIIYRLFIGWWAILNFISDLFISEIMQIYIMFNLNLRKLHNKIYYNQLNLLRK